MPDQKQTSEREPEAEAEPRARAEAKREPEADPEPKPEAEPEPPLLRIVKGNPTPEEVAALVTVVAAMRAGAEESAGRQRKPTSEWAAHRHRVRGTHRHGPGAWRASAR
jgi:hypothetical protein